MRQEPQKHSKVVEMEVRDSLLVVINFQLQPFLLVIFLPEDSDEEQIKFTRRGGQEVLV